MHMGRKNEYLPKIYNNPEINGTGNRNPNHIAEGFMPGVVCLHLHAVLIKTYLVLVYLSTNICQQNNVILASL